MMRIALFAFGIFNAINQGEKVAPIFGQTKFDYIKDNNEVKVLVKSKNTEGLSFAHSLALNVNMKIEREGIISITINANDMDKLKRNENIDKVEIVHDIVIDDPVSIENSVMFTMTETTPYGIPMVLQDIEFWNSLTPKGKVKVCIADTGYDLGHVDLPNDPDVIGSNNEEYNEDWFSDGNGHGTHCAGTVAAIGGNDKGVVGVIPDNKSGNFQLVIAKALLSNGSGSWDGVLKAVETCKANNANVISLSLGGSGYSAIFDEFFTNLYTNDGILLVAAAGNDGDSSYSYPASYGSLMSVAAVDSQNNHASFSQYNDQVEISAPGVDVLSTIPNNNIAFANGTSMATPHVAAVAGLLWMHFPNCANYQIRNVLDATAKDLNGKGCNVQTGYGLVQAKDAYALLSRNCGGDIGTVEPIGGCSQVHNISIQCENDSDCHDGDQCTSNACIDKFCVYEKLPCDQCGFVSMVKVEITTDNYPGETTWAIKDNDEVIISGGPYSKKNFTYSVSQCFGSGSYEFTIYDSWGDGLCCFYGNGSYFILVDDNQIISGSKFGDNETRTFDIEKKPTISPNTFEPTMEKQPTTTIFPTLVSPTLFPTATPPTIFPTVTFPTLFPTVTRPTIFPTATRPTLFPTVTPPTIFPTATPPTIFPTLNPPTIFPTVTPPTIFPTLTPPTIFPTVTPPTIFPTVTPPTIFPKVTLPTIFPTVTPPTIFPTANPPTIFPTVTPATIFPTVTPPTPLPCLPKNRPCAYPRDCCTGRCHWTKKICKDQV